MAEFPALPLWTDAYLGDTGHLTTIEHGAYLLLLITAWRTKTYDLPDDDKMLARFCRLTLRQWLRIKPVMIPFWKISDGRWTNGRLLDELEAVRRLQRQRSDAGKSSALKRLHRSSSTVQRNLNGISTPIPTPKEEERKNLIIGFGKKSGNGAVTVLKSSDRLAIFQKTLAESFDKDGWVIVSAAADASHPDHRRCLDICKKQAAGIHKGWPHQWPTGILKEVEQ